MDNVWYFNPGEEACELCQSAAGVYSEEPALPHESCDCTIEEHDIEASADGCEFEYRDPSMLETAENRATTTYTFFNCGNRETTAAVTSSAEVEDNLGSDLEHAIREQLGWAPPGHVTEAHFVAPTNTHGSIEATLVAYLVDAGAQQWQVCRKGGFRFEHKIEDLSGTYACIQAIELDIDSEACPGGREP